MPAPDLFEIMNPYHQLVTDYVQLLKRGRSLPLGTFNAAARPQLAPDAPHALLFSPHPDDECIVGGIALRLLRQAGVRLVNVAVTLGSKKERQAARLRELRNACDYIGFELVAAAPGGLERINAKSREQDPAHWSNCVEKIFGLLQHHQPAIVLYPHEKDWNSTHIGTHYLVMDALRRMPANFECHLVETEFWGAMADPNLMVEISPEDLGDMITATTFHIGEVARNPYHLLLPAWMMDNVRRGAEVAGGQGGTAPDFTFAALYRLSKWKNGRVHRTFEGGRQVPSSTNIGDLFN